MKTLFPATKVSKFWCAAKDGDAEARAIFERHYSRRRYADGRKPKLFMGPGGKLLLITPEADAIFAWRKFIDDSGQTGVNCCIFRNESPHLSSEMILDAEPHAWRKWPNERRLYTYVDPNEVGERGDNQERTTHPRENYPTALASKRAKDQPMKRNPAGRQVSDADPCSDCGECCTRQESSPMYVGHLPGSPFEHEDDANARRVRAMPQALRDELIAYKNNLIAGVKPPHPTYPACLWYDAATKRCKHHEIRPDICRNFDVGETACNRYRRDIGLVELTAQGRKLARRDAKGKR